MPVRAPTRLAMTAAFTSETGDERITAREALRRRDADGGAPRRVTYWSTHRLGARVPVHLVDSDVRRLHFARNRRGGGSGAEETLQHWLLKRALATLERVRIRIEGSHHVLALHRGAVEPLYPRCSKDYRADAHWYFTADTLLDKQWSNEVYVEVCHENPVPDHKLEALKAAGLPVIEVQIPSFLAFRDGEGATQAQQDAYTQRVHRFLNDPQHYYLSATALHNPVSLVVAEHRRILSEAQATAVAAGLALTESQAATGQLAHTHRLHLEALRTALPAPVTANLKAAPPQWCTSANGITAMSAVVPSPTASPAASRGDVQVETEDPDVRWWRRAAWTGLACSFGLATALLYAWGERVVHDAAGETAPPPARAATPIAPPPEPASHGHPKTGRHAKPHHL